MNQQLINGRYEVKDRLGRGSQGDVLKAYDHKLGRDVAIKLLILAGRLDEKARRGMQREAKVMAAFHHPNSVIIFDYDEIQDQNQPFIVMEFLDGETVDKIVYQLTDAEIEQLVFQVGTAIAKAHEQGLVHRDLKPSNLILVNRGQQNQRFVILDLGIAKLMESAQLGVGTFGSMTFSGSGTPLYMSPEQIEGKSVDHRSDIYAMGSLIYELFAGEAPFAGQASSVPSLINAVMHHAPKPLSQSARRPCSNEVSQLIDEALAKNPAARPSSMDEFVTRFQAAFVNQPVPSGSTPIVVETIYPTIEPESHIESNASHTPSTIAWVKPQPDQKLTAGDTDNELIPTEIENQVEPVEAELVDVQVLSPSSASHKRKKRLLAGIASILCIFLLGAIGMAIWYANSGSSGSLANSMDGDNRGDQFGNRKDKTELDSLDFGSQQLLEEVPWTVQPDYGSQGIDSFEFQSETPTGLSINPDSGRLSWTPNESQGPGEYTVAIVGFSDEQVVIQARLRLSVNEANLPPVLNSPETLTLTEGVPFLQKVTALDRDEPNQDLTFRLVSSEIDELEFDSSSGEIRWTPSEIHGGNQYEVDIEVSDGIASSLSKIKLNVEESNFAPLLSPVSKREVDELQELTIQLQAEDEDLPAASLSYGLLSRELQNATVDPETGLFRWTPSEADGPSDVELTFSVTDGLETTTLQVQIHVREVPQEPSIEEIETQNLRLGETLSLQPIVRDLDIPAGPISYDLESQPPGMTIDSSTGRITWTPPPDQARTSRGVFLVATSDDGLVSKQSIGITVDLGATREDLDGLTMRFIPAGFFGQSIRSPDDESTPDAWRMVEVPKPFWIGVHEVTRAQFGEFVSETSYQTQAEREKKSLEGWNEQKQEIESSTIYHWRFPGFEQGDNHPVVNVSQTDALEFCKWLSEKTGRTYRLPTIAEWEYAARAGINSKYLDGDDFNTIWITANVGDQTLRKLLDQDRNWQGKFSEHSDDWGFTAPVGEFSYNLFGLSDVCGNVWEWATYDPTTKLQMIIANPGRMRSTVEPTLGGSWYSGEGHSYIGHIHPMDKSAAEFDLGFRVVCEIEER